MLDVTLTSPIRPLPGTSSLLTLTTDFGDESPYVAAMKGVILGINPEVRLHDLGHHIPPQNVRHAAFFLAGAIPYFPPGALHVIVVDPGVGSARALLYVEVAEHRLLAPDNGCWTGLCHDAKEAPRVIRLTEPRYWRHPVSATFHGRDILAPVAGHLSRGLDPQLLGPVATDWVKLEIRPPRRTATGWLGEVVFVDHFGNLISDIPGDILTQGVLRICVGRHEVARHARTYADAEPGTLLALTSSNGMLEIAVAQGDAAARLGTGVGAEIVVEVQAGVR